MKWMLLTAMISAAFTWGQNATTKAAEEKVFVVKKHVAIGDKDGNALVSAKFGEGADRDSGWLGIQMSIKSGEEADGLVDREGVVVTNVAVGSPADEAGFEQNDVIIEVDDQGISDDLGSFVGVVKSASAGERMKFTVMRNGERRTLVATLGKRGNAGDIQWAYENDHEMILREAIRSHAKVLKRGDDGEWTFEVLGDGEDCKALPFGIGKMLPRMHTRVLKSIQNDDDHHIVIEIQQDDEGVTVETTDDGSIKVSRTDDESGEESVTIYADEDELAASDEEAFDIYNDAQRHAVFAWKSDGESPHFMFHFDDDEHHEWIADLEGRIADSSDAVADAMAMLKNMNVEFEFAHDGDDDHSGHSFYQFLHEHKARRTIRENPDGTIDVIVRKGGDELVTRHSDADDLSERNPEAYDIYLDLQDADE